jgi:hypothetical protein
MAQRKVLYSIFVPPGRARTLLDAIRLFARPTAKYPAHVTVRGPYAEPADMTEWESVVCGQRIDINGVGTFFENDQNTVFLKVHSAAVRAVWDKPDYPDYNPHLTVCDALSRLFAEGVLAVLSAHPPRFSFRAEGLEMMVLGNGRSLLRETYEPSRLREFMKHPPTLADIDAAADATRIGWVAEVAVHLADAGR